jgi:hypothetical protein
MNKKVENEVREAYCDSNTSIPWEESSKRRNLNFLASESVSVLDAVSIMRKAVPSYNEFEPDLLTRLPKGSKVSIAREGSVCIYVMPPILKEIKAMKADEWSTQGNLTRIWWD